MYFKIVYKNDSEANANYSDELVSITKIRVYVSGYKYKNYTLIVIIVVRCAKFKKFTMRSEIHFLAIPGQV